MGDNPVSTRKTSLSVGGYRLTHYPNADGKNDSIRWWLCTDNGNGEGMGMSDKDVYRMFDEFFKENF